MSLGIHRARADHLAHQIRDDDRVIRACGGISLGSGHFNQFTDQFAQVVHLLLRAIDGRPTILGRPCQLDGKTQACEWRAQFMGNILQQSPLRDEERLQALRHLVERR